MKTKYERMNKIEKNTVYNNFKKNENVLYKKLKRMFILCYVGIVYSVFTFIYDFFLYRGKFSYILDIIIFIICLVALIKTKKEKIKLLNDYVLNNK